MATQIRLCCRSSVSHRSNKDLKVMPLSLGLVSNDSMLTSGRRAGRSLNDVQNMVQDLWSACGKR